MNAPAAATEHHHHAHGPANRRRRVLETVAPLFVRFPALPTGTAAVVLHDVFGLTERIERCCRALASRGHLAVSPYFYHQNGGREFTPERLDVAHAAWARLAATDIEADVHGALDYLQRRCGIARTSIVVAGFGAGGELAARLSLPDLGVLADTDAAPGPPDADAEQRLVARVDRALIPIHHRREQQ